MDTPHDRVFRFERFTLDMTRRRLCADDREIALRAKSFDVLCCLVGHAGRLVAKDDIIGTVWPGVIVTDESLARCVSDIRLALDDRAQRIVKTISGRGYMLAAPLDKPVPSEPAVTATSSI
jgi:DNA-binding winged helix-turn-helix (wHTH) protein